MICLHRQLQKGRHRILDTSRTSSRCIYSFSTSTHPTDESKCKAASGPVITFLSPSPHCSRSAIEFMNTLFSFPVMAAKVDGTDKLDEMCFGPNNALKWDSAACICPSSGSVLHFLSLDKESNESNGSETGVAAHSLIAIHGNTNHSAADSANASISCIDAVQLSRILLAEEIQNRQFFNSPSTLSSLESRLRGSIIHLMHQMGKQPTSSWLFAKVPTSSSYQPVHLDMRPFNHTANKNAHISRSNNNEEFQLRELAIPFFPEMSTLQQQLSKSSLSRPIPGLYQYIQPCFSSNANTSTSKQSTNNGLILRPLPSASEDFRLPQPSLTYQCKSLPEAQEMIKKLGGATAKIGWRGDGQNGSLIVSHPTIRGLDIRLVETTGVWVPNSYFDEAQEALLAASLDDLQSSHVITEGNEDKDKGIDRDVDPKTLRADCWVETRANIKNPLGFLSKRWTLKSQSNPAVAKPPDLPYE